MKNSEPLKAENMKNYLVEAIGEKCSLLSGEGRGEAKGELKLKRPWFRKNAFLLQRMIAENVCLFSEFQKKKGER